MRLLKRTWADISLDNLAHNYALLRGNVPSGCKFLGVVKADAYGHGAVPISRRLKEMGADYLAVSNFEEALQLRRADIRLPILILGYTPPVYAPDLADMSIRQEVHSLDYANQLNARMDGVGKRLSVHLKLDTGMSRLGFPGSEDPQTFDALCKSARLPHLDCEGIFTHFPVADSFSASDRDFTRQQFARFTGLIDALHGAGIEFELRHCCNSAATILYPEFALDMVRPGIATYGISPSPELAGRLALKPLMSLHTTISQIRDYGSGVSVSYGRTYTTTAPCRVAVLCIGYADGLPRKLSNSVQFLLRGKRVPVLGRICMDMCMVDVTDVPDARVGDRVTVFGGEGSLSVEDLAATLDTIPYEILCGINKRTPRIYLDGEQRIEVLQYIV